MLGIVWFDVLRIRRRVAIENVAIAYPELSRADAVGMARSSLRHMGRTIFEFALFPFFKVESVPRVFDVQGLEYLEAAFAKEKGVLMLGLHLGNGDLGIAALSRLGWPVSLISKTFRTKWLNDLWFGMRAKHGTQFISPEKSSFQILRALKSKRAVFFVLDQFMGPPIGCRTKFFGRETGTAMGLAIMAERSGAPVVPAYTYRQPNGRHMIVFESEIAWQDASRSSQKRDEAHDENIASMTQIYTDRIEAIVRRHPEQWMWIHRRWKNF
jgi:Kdo2-lipid IVA lauroyltransferase/acyltransferase